MEYFLQILEASFPLPVVHFAAGLLTGIALYHWLGPEASRLRLDRLRLQCEREDRANAERKEAAQRRLANCKKRQEEAQKQEEQAVQLETISSTSPAKDFIHHLLRFNADRLAKIRYVEVFKRYFDLMDPYQRIQIGPCGHFFLHIQAL